MSNSSTVDETVLAQTMDNLTAKITAIINQKNSISKVQMMLNSIKKIVGSTTTDPTTGDITNTMVNPIDQGTGVTMTDARRLQIYNSAIQLANQILGSN